MEANKNGHHRLILKVGVVMSLLLMVLVGVGLAGWASKGSGLHAALPFAAGLSVLNLLACAAALRK